MTGYSLHATDQKLFPNCELPTHKWTIEDAAWQTLSAWNYTLPT